MSDSLKQGVKSSISWLELANYDANPADTDALRCGLAFVSGVLKKWNGTAWSSVTSGGSAVGSLDNAYDDGGVITVDSAAVTLNGVNMDTAVLAITGDGDSAGALLTFTHSTATRNDVLGTGSTWLVTGQGKGTFVQLASPTIVSATSGNTALTIDAAGTGTIGIGGTSTGAVTITPALTATASITITGAAGSNKLTVTAGDVSVADGSVTIADDDNAASLSVTNSGATTIGAAAAGGVAKIACASLTTGALLSLELTEGTLNGGWYWRAWDVTATAAVATLGENGLLTLAGGTAGTNEISVTAGDIFLSDTDTSIFESEDGVGTLLTLDNKAGVIASDAAVLLLDAGGAVASGGNILRIAPTGSPNAGAIGIEYVGASKAMQAMYIDGDPTANSVVEINGGGAMTDGIAVLKLSNDGNLATGGNILSLVMGGTPHAQACALEITAALDARAIDVTSSAATASAVRITGAGATATTTAVLEVIGSGTPAATTSNVARFAFTGTATNKPRVVEIVGTGKDVGGLYVDADNTTTHAVSITGTGVLNAGRMLKVDNDSTPAANTDAVAEITFTGTATNNPIVLSVNNSTKNALPLLVTSNVASATREVAMFVQDSTTGANEVLSLQQDDLDQPFIDFVTTIGVGNAIEAVGAKTLTTTHFIMVKIPGGLARYFPVGTIA